MSKARLSILLIALLIFSVPSLAQDDDCADLVDTMVTTAAEACTELEQGEICYATTPVTLTAADGEPVEAAAGEMLTLDKIAAVQTGTADLETGQWGIATLNPSDGLFMVLFGAAEIANATPAEGEALPTATVHGLARDNLNLRAGPGTTYPVLDVLAMNEQATADGKNAAGDWLRLRRNEMTVWASAEYLAVDEGDVNALEPLEATTLRRPDLYTVPMQALTLTTDSAASACAGAGLLIQYRAAEDAAPFHLKINGIHLTFQSATLLVRAADSTSLDIAVIDGSARVTMPGTTPVDAETGAFVQVTPGIAPDLLASYPFAALQNVPLALLSQPLQTCLIGLEPGMAPVTMHAGPGTAYVRLPQFTEDIHYAARGYADSAEGETWWQLETPNYLEAWVPQSAVSTRGACDAVTEVTAPPITAVVPGDPTQPPAADAPPPTAAPPAEGSEEQPPPETTESFVPPGQTVWQAYPGDANLSGTCNSPPLVLCDHLVAINNTGNAITWRGQEPNPYTLQATGPNSFAFSGRRTQNDGNITMNLTFTSPTTWSMTMNLVFDNDPQCTQTLYYTADFKW